MSKEILVVDDEAEIAELLEVYLENEGYHVTKCLDGDSAWQCIQEKVWDLALLDIMLPGINGFELCRRIRKEHTFPVIMLTAKVEDVDKINGLTIGADDYITKPFNPLEVVARVKAQLRRAERYNDGGAKSEFDVAGLTINTDSHQCIYCGKHVELTPIEFDILLYLCENQGKVLSAEQIFEHVWKEKCFDSNNTVMVHIRRLREKLGEPARNAKIIKTVWGVGYTIEN